MGLHCLLWYFSVGATVHNLVAEVQKHRAIPLCASAHLRQNLLSGQSHSALLHICAKTHSQGNPTLRFCTSAPKPTLRAFASALLRFCAKNRLCASANASALLHCAAL